MFEAKLVIEIPGLEALAAAIAHRAQTVGAAADVLAQRRAEYGVTPTAPAAPARQIPPPPPAVPVNPTPAVTYTPQAPTAPATMPNTAPTAYTAPGTAPTTPPPSFTVDQVGTAGADMIRDNPAKMPDLLALLAQFGVQAISELTPDKLGPFATALRGLGAKI